MHSNRLPIQRGGIKVTLNDVGNFISLYGFPVVACCALFYQNWMQSKRHKEEADAWSKALEANTQAIIRLELTLGKFDERTRLS